VPERQPGSKTEPYGQHEGKTQYAATLGAFSQPVEMSAAQPRSMQSIQEQTDHLGVEIVQTIALSAPEAVDTNRPGAASSQRSAWMGIGSVPTLISAAGPVGSAVRAVAAHGLQGAGATGSTNGSLPSSSGTSLFGHTSAGSSALWVILLGGSALAALRFLEQRTVHIPAGICLAACSPPG